jgi:methylmalonyl-CoA/ethylmalonyl-CoA epimerase
METHDIPIRVDHVGIAVESVSNAEPVLLALGCDRITDDIVNDRFRWVYYELGNASRLELIEPVADDSFLTEYLDANGPGLHHVTLEVADLDAVTEVLEGEGLSIVDRAVFDGWREAFVSPRNPTGVLFQLMEYTDDYPEIQGVPPNDLYVGGHQIDTQKQ